MEINDLIKKAAGLIAAAERPVVFSGAGISTESGIPDFRSPGGIWSRFDPDDFTYQKFVSDTESRRKQWQLLGEGHLTTDAQPNLAHYAVAELNDVGKLDCVITQNVDNLHQKAGVPDDKVYELHGNLQWAICLDCGRRYPFEQIKIRLDEGEEIPDCADCKGMLKPDAVFFGESLPAEVLAEAERRSSNSDVFIVIGSTLIIYPAAFMPSYALNAGAKLIIINLSSTPLDGDANVLIQAKAGEAMSGIVERVKQELKKV